MDENEEEFSDLPVRAVALEAAAISWSGSRGVYTNDEDVIKTARRFEAYLRMGE